MQISDKRFRNHLKISFQSSAELLVQFKFGTWQSDTLRFVNSYMP